MRNKNYRESLQEDAHPSLDGSITKRPKRPQTGAEVIGQQVDLLNLRYQRALETAKDRLELELRNCEDLDPETLEELLSELREASPRNEDDEEDIFDRDSGDEEPLATASEAGDLVLSGVEASPRTWRLETTQSLPANLAAKLESLEAARSEGGTGDGESGSKEGLKVKVSLFES